MMATTAIAASRELRPNRVMPDLRSWRGGLRRISPSSWYCCALNVGIVRKGDQGRETGVAFRAMPNVTRVVVAPILGTHRRNQASTALNATHGDPHSPPRPIVIVPFK